jgi:hypothetical protein
LSHETLQRKAAVLITAFITRNEMTKRNNNKCWRKGMKRRLELVEVEQYER